ncbi:hypothetical protein QUA02_06805 [Microcoleus sp. SVA1_A4]
MRFWQSGEGALEVLSVSGVAIVKLFVVTHILHHSQEQARCLFHKR